MATEPLSRISLRATSISDDLGFIALADLATILKSEDKPSYRIIGGQMVMILAARWHLGTDLYRATLDADLGVSPIAVSDNVLVNRLVDLGYQQVAGDRFSREVTDIPAGDASTRSEAVIDVLVPAYTSRPSSSRKAGERLVATEVLGLASALQRSPVIMELELRRLGGDLLNIALSFPDEASALVLKAFATQARNKFTDCTDVWRCLEVAYTAGVTINDFAAAEMSKGVEVIRSLFSQRNSPGMSAITQDLALSKAAADERYTRIRALIQQVLG